MGELKIEKKKNKKMYDIIMPLMLKIFAIYENNAETKQAVKIKLKCNSFRMNWELRQVKKQKSKNETTALMGWLSDEWWKRIMMKSGVAYKKKTVAYLKKNARRGEMCREKDNYGRTKWAALVT